MNTLIFSAGAKGGTGKSRAIELITSYLRVNGCIPHLIDMDDESRTLYRMFPEAEKVNARDPRNPYTQDKLLDSFYKDGHKLVIADLKAGVGEDTLRWWDKIEFDDCPDIKFICIGSITSNADSVTSFLTWANSLRERVSYIIFKNEKDGVIFPIYDNSIEVLKFQEQFHPFHVNIEEVPKEFMHEIDRLNLTFEEILQASKEGKSKYNGKDIGDVFTSKSKVMHIRSFRNKVFAQLDKVDLFQEIISEHKK